MNLPSNAPDGGGGGANWSKPGSKHSVAPGAVPNMRFCEPVQLSVTKKSALKSTPLWTGYAYNDSDGLTLPNQDRWPGYRAMLIRAEGSAAPDCPWLSSNPTNGTIPAGGNQNVNVVVDATGLPTGTYNCSLRITSNDPDLVLN